DAIAVRHSPRTRAFLMIGGSAMLALQPGDAHLIGLLTELGDDLVAKLADCERTGWRWFEPELAYDNGRLPEALLRAGLALDRNDFVIRGLETLTWLAEQQTAKAGHYRPIGSDSFGRAYAPPLAFDQQPLEAWAMIDACDAAFAATGEHHWQSLGVRVYQWFLGNNDLGLPIADPVTGECCDGLMPTGLNRNQGAESVLAFHMATVMINRLMTDVARKVEYASGGAARLSLRTGDGEAPLTKLDGQQHILTPIKALFKAGIGMNVSHVSPHAAKVLA
ncbi:MAG: hypothetical protein M3Y22_09200, partial [Pseudomonadota bacterium]|nr:hypothetical protein [Pseudomonadota bacterium]